VPAINLPNVIMQKKPAKVPVHRAPPPKQVRIIGGMWKRSTLPVLNALGLRPTPDRVRETVFNWINHLWDGGWTEAECLDLFAGTGALGFEAASRGAAAVTMVDTHSPVIAQLADIKTRLNADKVELIRGDALATAHSLAQRGRRFDLVFLDPPYHQDFLAKALPLCQNLLKPGGLVYAESGTALPFAPEDGSAVPAWLASWEMVRSDKAGIVFYNLLKLQQPVA
jgi:16S rRNA (guanine966-N2)-methyltransferase